MRTEVYLWIEPLIMNHQRCSGKIFFNCVVDGDHSKSDIPELEDLIQGSKMTDIMDFADIDSNWNYGVVSAKATNKKPCIEFAESPEQVKQEKDTIKTEKLISKVVRSKKPISLTKENVELKDGGMIEVSLPSLKIKDQLDFAKIWNSLEKNFIGKIKKGDSIILTDDHGNKIFEMVGGSFLSVGLAHINIYDTKIRGSEKRSSLDLTGLKGGLYLRDDGSLDIGDFKRTIYLKIYTNNLLKASLRLKKPLMEIAANKLLQSKNQSIKS